MKRLTTLLSLLLIMLMGMTVSVHGVLVDMNDNYYAEPDDESITTITYTPTAYLQNAQVIAIGKLIQVFRVPTRDSTGAIKYYNLSIPLTVGSDGKIAATATVTSVVSPTFSGNNFVAGTYADPKGGSCKVTTSILNGGRQEVAFACTSKGGYDHLSQDIITGPINGHPYELDLRAAGIDKIPGYTNFSWGKVGNTDAVDWWGCFYTGDIISARQVGNILELSCYKSGNTQKCGISLTKQ